MAELLAVEFRAVIGFPNYRVGNDGSLWSRARGEWRQLVGGIDKDGYRKTILCRDGERHHRRIASIVLEAFVGPCPDGLEACHDNGINDDDRADNLRWDTHANNIADKKLHGTHQQGELHGCCKLTESKVREIRARREAGEIYRTIAADLGVALNTVQAICARRLWKHVA